MIKPVVLVGDYNVSNTVSPCGEFLITIRGRVGNMKDYDLGVHQQSIGHFATVLSMFNIMSNEPFLPYRNFVFNNPQIYFSITRM